MRPQKNNCLFEIGVKKTSKKTARKKYFKINNLHAYIKLDYTSKNDKK